MATEWRFHPAARSVVEARRRVSEALQEWHLVALCDAVVLLTSELVTNAVLHARTPVTVTVTREGDGVRVSVADGSHVTPARRRTSATATTGRGLQLLDKLADHWAVDTDSHGKTVWFTVSGDRDPWEHVGDIFGEAEL